MVGSAALLALISSCQVFSFMDTVQKDKRDAYKASQSLPDLEVPPDLILESAPDAFEVDVPTDSVAAIEKQPTSAPTGEIEQSSSFNGLEIDAESLVLWPLLVDFFIVKGRALAVSDEELGVIETNWSAPYFQNDQTVRDRFKVFVETVPPASTRLVLTSEKELFRQSEDGSADGSWVAMDQDAMDNYNQGTIKEMRLFFRDKLASSGSSIDG